jgi:putative DNA primase/helicase
MVHGLPRKIADFLGWERFTLREGRGVYLCTDTGNAERLSDRHGANLRYCHPWGKWLLYDGTRWRVDDRGAIVRLGKDTARSIFEEAREAPSDAAAKELGKWASSSLSESKLKSMISLAQSEPGIPVLPDELDASPDPLNVLNGTIDLRSGKLREHRREDLITRIPPLDYAPDARAPAWETFLERVLPAEELRAFVQRAAGYSATGDTLEQWMFINHGTGANGKSTFQETLSAALGDYAMRTPTEMLLARRYEGVPNDVARLKGARFVSASETEESRRLAESRIKDLTGQDTITARFMKAEWFDFAPTHKLWLSTNHKPEIRGTDAAIWRRIRLVPWTISIPPAEQDKKLPEKLRAELPGILAWVVQGCLQWRRGGLQAPEEVRQATGATAPRWTCWQRSWRSGASSAPTPWPSQTTSTPPTGNGARPTASPSRSNAASGCASPSAGCAARRSAASTGGTASASATTDQDHPKTKVLQTKARVLQAIHLQDLTLQDHQDQKSI